MSHGSLTRRQQRQVHQAVQQAEAGTGLQLCVYLGDVEESNPRSAAEALFATSGLQAQPAILVVVAPAQRRVEIVTAPTARRRVDDLACQRIVAQMMKRFAEGDLAGGLLTGIADLAAAAGPGEAAPGDEDLPDIVQGTADRSH